MKIDINADLIFCEQVGVDNGFIEGQKINLKLKFQSQKLKLQVKNQEFFR